jgi:hypothetical protein
VSRDVPERPRRSRLSVCAPPLPAPVKPASLGATGDASSRGAWRGPSATARRLLRPTPPPRRDRDETANGRVPGGGGGGGLGFLRPATSHYSTMAPTSDFRKIYSERNRLCRVFSESRTKLKNTKVQSGSFRLLPITFRPDGTSLKFTCAQTIDTHTTLSISCWGKNYTSGETKAEYEYRFCLYIRVYTEG